MINKRRKYQLQFHNECLIILHRNSVAVCACCAFAMYVYQFRFETGNSFTNDYKMITKYYPIGMISINNKNIIFFKGYIDNNPREYYFICDEMELLTKLSNPISQSFIT